MLEFSEDPWRLAEAVDTLLVPPPPIDVSSVRRPLVSVDVFLERFRSILRDRRGFAFDEAVHGLDRLSQAAAFLAVLELVKRGEVAGEQAETFGPIRVVAVARRRAGDRVSELTRSVEALLFISTEPLSLARAGDARPRRRPSASSGRSMRCSTATARSGRASCWRRRPVATGSVRRPTPRTSAHG